MKKRLVFVITILFFVLIFTLSAAAQVDPWEKAREEGIVFRAVGNEPDWMIELSQDKSIKFVNHDGELEIKVPVDDIWLGPEGEDRIYYVENEVIPFQLIIMKKQYRDNVSGEVFPYQVRLIFPEKSYTGGGKMLVEEENGE
ncbi:MAG: hypothetical protein UMU04_08880 [Halanaerobiales bacterium]|nr:hypothetical protein [Halanaerobiales bacterium]